MATHGMPASPLVDSGLQTGLLQSRFKKRCKNMGALRNYTDLRSRFSRSSARRVWQSWWKGVATRSLLSLHALKVLKRSLRVFRGAPAHDILTHHTARTAYHTQALAVVEWQWSSHTVDTLGSTSGGSLELITVLALVQWFAKRRCARSARALRAQHLFTGSFTCARLDDV